MRYADVIVPLAVEGMYTYTVPVSLESEVREGTLVLVSFAGNKRYTALVGRRISGKAYRGCHRETGFVFGSAPEVFIVARRVLYGHSRRSDEGGFTGGFPFGEFYQHYPYHGGSGLCGVDYERKNLTPIFTAWRICFAERSGEISEN